MNVVTAWRDRARALRAEYWRCENCGRFAGVRRLACSSCGRPMSDSNTAALPRSFHALAGSHAHSIVETMDQISEQSAVMLVQARNGQLFAFPLCETDAKCGAELVGETLELGLRRTRNNLGSNDPIPYGRKLAASAMVRSRLKSNSSKQG